uniref:Hexosyltransferase n=1 Tax=Aegilops tauschii TaxID=37682 RepID=M8BEI8_AEGTA
MAPMPKRIVKDEQKKAAYVTFLAGSGDYWMGVVGLAKGLRAVKSAYPLVVAVLPDVPEDHRRKLGEQGCPGLPRPRDRAGVPAGEPDPVRHGILRHQLLQAPHLEVRGVREDGVPGRGHPVQVFDNIDHLFDLDKGSFYAVMDCFCEKTWSHTPQYKIGYCQQCPDRVLLNRLVVTDPTPFAEQDFLNMFFRDVYKPIPPVYNLVLAMLWRHPENVQLEKVKVVHYCAAGSKPWRYTGEEANMDREDIKMLVKKWWDIYNDEGLDYKAGDETTNLLRGILVEAGAVKYFPAPSAA